jgi:hypothetical protein
MILYSPSQLRATCFNRLDLRLPQRQCQVHAVLFPLLLVAEDLIRFPRLTDLLGVVLLQPVRMPKPQPTRSANPITESVTTKFPTRGS